MKRLLIMLAVLVLGFIAFSYQTKNPVRVGKVEVVKQLPVVRVQGAELVDCELAVLAHGRVEPVTRTSMVSEISGAVLEVSDKLKVGGEFEKGEVMLKLESVRYQQAVELAKLNVAEAELRVVQETTKAAQAKRDWGKLGRKGAPSALSLRVPQLKAAEALLASSKVALKKAEYDLLAATMLAPYDCVVVSAAVDDGGYVTGGSAVAEVYSLEDRQVRLPIKLEYFPYVNEKLLGNKVELRAQVGGGEQVWLGEVQRVEGLVDRMTQSMMLVVELSQSQGALPPYGLYVDSLVNLGLLADVIELPARALRDNSTILLVGAEGKLEIRAVQVKHRQGGMVYLENENLAGMRVVLSPMEFAVSGMRVEIEQTDQKGAE